MFVSCDLACEAVDDLPRIKVVPLVYNFFFWNIRPYTPLIAKLINSALFVCMRVRSWNQYDIMPYLQSPAVHIAKYKLY